MTTQSIDRAKTDAFTEKLIGMMNGAAVSLMISIGHRTGLFDVLDQLPPSNSQQIAKAARLNERYVREWLGAMVTGGIVLYDPATKSYHLPAEHAAVLTRAASPNNLAVQTQFLSVLGGVEDGIVECFHQGGGVPYEQYHRFHEVMAEESAQTVVAALESAVIPLAPGLADQLRAGIDVLDVGCGSGRAMIHLAAAFPSSRFTGFDFSVEAVERARAEAAEKQLNNVRFEQRDVSHLQADAQFDLITAFDAIHDQARPAQVLDEIYRALRPGGTFLMQDIRASSHVHQNIENPIAPFLYTISCMHCMTVSLALGGEGLGTCWGEEKAVEMLAEAGFQSVRVERLEHDIMNNFYIARKQ